MDLAINLANNTERAMALSYFNESEAPRDFRVSSTDSDGHYKKCRLCYTVKRNFYCPDCIKGGNFVHSSMPYSDRYAEKQTKLLRVKANRRYVLDRCIKLLAPKMTRSSVYSESRQSSDKIDLLKLAIEQRKKSIDDKRRALSDLTQYNNELKIKLPRYQKRVSSLEKHAQTQRIELQNKMGTYNDQAQSLAALRRSRIRQLTKYIFPVYMTYDSSDSIEDMEFVGDDAEEELPKRAQLHIVAPWINADGDFSHVQAWVSANKENAQAVPISANPLYRSVAALALAAQLVTLIASTLDVRLPHALSLSEYSGGRASESALWWRARRVSSCAGGLCARAALAPPRPHPAPAPLAALCTAAAADSAALGRVDGRAGGEGEDDVWEAWGGAEPEPEPEDCEPEHLHWPEPAEMEELSCTPPMATGGPPAGPAASLVTSAAASIASIWRGWTK